MLNYMAMEKLNLSKSKTLVNLGNSILKYFGVTPFHETLKEADEILKKSHKEKVALVLFDGFGKVIAEHYKESIPFIYSHKAFEFNSVFPPTTVAATTALTTGLYPIENGHVGWTQFFKKHNAAINVFPSNDKFEHAKFYPSVQQNILKPVYLWELINKSQKYNATSISSYEKKTPLKEDDFEYFFSRADELIKTHNFVYIYSSMPDHLLHDLGCFNETIKENLIYLETKLKKLINDNSDTLFLLVADHGFRDINEISIKEHQDFFETLSRPYFIIEPAFAGFFVKRKAEFELLAHKYYEDKFYIYSKEELLKDNLLGYGNKSSYVDETLPDYFLISKGDYIFFDGEEPVGFKGAHAGGSKEEKELYLFSFNN